jgi:cytochrome P450
MTLPTVEEVLRFEGPVKIPIRWVVQDHERDGRQVRAGDRVFLVLQSATRDKGTFADPDRFDIERPAKRLHVGFGRGVHACLSARLARIQARAALPKILSRFGTSRSPAR